MEMHAAAVMWKQSIKEFGFRYTKLLRDEEKVYGPDMIQKEECIYPRDLVQLYGIRKALKDNAPDVSEMKTSIFASLYHCMSTDSKPQYSKCLIGAESWWFFQRAIAQGETTKSHKKNVDNNTLSELVKKNSSCVSKTGF
ncbi:hypothetical protein AVEN_94450-1 [Araneus ventricosus]|uniref:Uncharacterized protein n=1 Tax=Araneus ventricosus TaxID=182803 RepID=A0A4Y2G143_ARAVE|nr:hypothetical protein AVEN_94450-1 [Araneus ventricosus]